MSDATRDTLNQLIGWHLRELEFRLGASIALAPEGVSAADWQREQKQRGYMLYRVPLDGGTEPARNSALALTLRDLAAVADGEVRGGPEGDEVAVQDMIQTVAESLFSRPGTAAYDVPADWWASGVGRLCRLALAVAEGDDSLIPIAEAAQRLGVTINTVVRAIEAGRLRAVAEPDAPNPQHGRRLVFAAEVERWQREREGR